jgi:membrane-associated protein
MARFVPIVRTFAPFVAGVGVMPYLRFLAFSVFGTVLWVGGLTTLGYLFGNVEFIKKNLSVVLIGIVALSFMPACIEYLRARLATVGRE